MMIYYFYKIQINSNLSIFKWVIWSYGCIWLFNLLSVYPGQLENFYAQHEHLHILHVWFTLHCRLDGLDPNAYAAFQASRDLKDVVERVVQNKDEAGGKPGMSKKLSVRASLMTPVLPMLVIIVFILSVYFWLNYGIVSYYKWC